jgi:hypothetical protein
MRSICLIAARCLISAGKAKLEILHTVSGFICFHKKTALFARFVL